MHLDCWVREVNFAHKLMALYGTVFLVWFVLFSRLKRSSMISNAKKKAFFNETKEWDSMRSSVGGKGGGKELHDVDEDDKSDDSDDSDEDSIEDGGEGEKAAMEKDFYSKHGNVAQVTVGVAQTMDALLDKADYQQSLLEVRAKRRTLIFFVFVSQTPLIHFTLKMFSCTRVNWDGDEVLELDPRISCSNALYVTASR